MNCLDIKQMFCETAIKLARIANYLLPFKVNTILDTPLFFQ